MPGHDDLRPELGLGHATLPAPRRSWRAYTEAGGNFLDTANIYQDEASETILGELVEEDRDRYVLATKYTLAHGTKTTTRTRAACTARA